jgi:hypothetical protein
VATIGASAIAAARPAPGWANFEAHAQEVATRFQQVWDFEKYANLLAPGGSKSTHSDCGRRRSDMWDRLKIDSAHLARMLLRQQRNDR